jgi:AcrR family transcriptional regulator
MTRKKSMAKKEKLIAAAGEVFIKKGFRDATVAEICALAEANISAVNYHFGSKEALYQEAWRHSFTESLETYPLDGGVSGTASAEDRLRGHVTAMILRIADEKNKDFFIAQMELINPTGLLKEVMKTELIPMREKTRALVRELIGPDATEQQVHYCTISIASLCFHPMVMQRTARRTLDSGMPAVIEDPREFADHVVSFVLAGIRNLRNEGSRS